MRWFAKQRLASVGDLGGCSLVHVARVHLPCFLPGVSCLFPLPTPHFSPARVRHIISKALRWGRDMVPTPFPTLERDWKEKERRKGSVGRAGTTGGMQPWKAAAHEAQVQCGGFVDAFTSSIALRLHLIKAKVME